MPGEDEKMIDVEIEVVIEVLETFGEPDMMIRDSSHVPWLIREYSQMLNLTL